MPLMWDNMTRTKCNIFGQVWLWNMESKQMQDYSIIWTIVASKQEFFFNKVAPVQSIADIVPLNFWLILLPFISSCTTIYFFIKNIFFSQMIRF